MSGADLVLYRRMRGIFWGVLVIGVIGLPALLVLGLTIPAQLDLYGDELTRELARPNAVLSGGFALAGVLASIGAVILGATAGSVDLQRGVLRDLVLTGRSRGRVVAGQLVGAGVLLVAALMISFAISVVVGLTLSPGGATTEWNPAAREGAQYLLGVAYALPFAAGVALLVGSRGPAIAVFFAVTFIVDGIMSSIPKVSDAWIHVSLIRADQQVIAWVLEEPLPYDRSVEVSALVLLGWATIPLAIGLVRLGRRDL